MGIKDSTAGVKLVMIRPLFIFIICFFNFIAVISAIGSEVKSSTANELKQFANAEMRQRYYGLIGELRCPKCQNQNLADSDAPIATDLRNELYLLMTDNYSDAEILAFMESRYGEFVLYAPPVNKVTAVLWIIPAGLGLLGVAIIAFIVSRNQQEDGAAND